MLSFRLDRRSIFSLPLMGIGNSAWPSIMRSPYLSSLPLMGIGNRVATIGRMVHPRILITPHGDREHRAAYRRRSSATSHYPSWGSGTPGSNRRPQSRPRSSLPLMGIGNGYRCRCCPDRTGTHYPSWGSGTAQRSQWPCSRAISLPLMGIGNLIRHVTNETQE